MVGLRHEIQWYSCVHVENLICSFICATFNAQAFRQQGFETNKSFSLCCVFTIVYFSSADQQHQLSNLAWFLSIVLSMFYFKFLFFFLLVGLGEIQHSVALINSVLFNVTSERYILLQLLLCGHKMHCFDAERYVWKDMAVDYCRQSNLLPLLGKRPRSSVRVSVRVSSNQPKTRYVACADSPCCVPTPPAFLVAWVFDYLLDTEKCGVHYLCHSVSCMTFN